MLTKKLTFFFNSGRSRVGEGVGGRAGGVGLQGPQDGAMHREGEGVGEQAGGVGLRWPRDSARQQEGEVIVGRTGGIGLREAARAGAGGTSRWR
jgi:hypothetical protein